MEYRVLGSLEVRREDGPLTLGGPKQRALLALLLVNANRVVARDRLIDELWGESPPDTVVKTTQVYVSRLRKLLPDGALITRAPGYLLAVEREELDSSRFERLVADARGTVPSRASRLLREGLALWRGPPLAEFDEPFARAERGRLEDLRVAALEERIDAELALGLHAELAGELEALIAERPHRERLRAQQMLALYRCGRQADALAAFRDARAALDELGLEPGADLRTLERQILTHDRALDLGPDVGSVALPASLVTSSPLPFVGRADELTTLGSLLARAEHGAGSLVLLSGEPGAGKTRLVREFAQEAAERGALVCYGTSDPSVTVPHQPLLEWLEFLMRSCDPAVLGASIGDGAEPLARLFPAFAAFADPPAPAADPSTDRFLLQSAVAAFFRRLGGTRPLLLVAEDIHWADAETLLLLGRLARTVPDARILVVATFRQPGEELGPGLADTLAGLGRLDGVTRIALDNLRADEVAAFVRDATDSEASDELLAAIGELTDGTPLLVCELWRELVASGAIEISETAVSLVRPLAELRSPERIGQLLDQRLSRLSPETATLIEHAAVAGPRFDVRVVADAACLDAPALANALDGATRSGIVEDLPAASPAYRFTHELIRRAAYVRLSGIRRAELHLRVGEALERVHGVDPSRVLPELAHHFTVAAPLAGTDRAVDYNVRAAEAAIASAAYHEATSGFETALELGIDDPVERARVQAELGSLLFHTGRTGESEALLSESLDAATGLEERGLALRALVHRASQRLSSDPQAGSAEILRVAEEAIATFEQLGDSLGLAAAEELLGLALSREGRAQESSAALGRALAHAEVAGDHVIRRDIIGRIAIALWGGMTPVDEAIHRIDELRELSANDPALDAGLCRARGVLLAMACRFDEAQAAFAASGPVLDAADESVLSLNSRFFVAEAKELAGDAAGAKEQFVAAFERMRDARGEGSEARALKAAAELARICCDHGDWDEAAEYLSYGERVDRFEPPAGKDYAYLRLAARARLAAHRGESSDALELALRAIELAERRRFGNHRARTWLALAEVHRAAGRPADAEAALAEAIRIYEAKGNAAAVARLKVAVAQ